MRRGQRCTNWTRLVLLPVLTGHVSSAGGGGGGASAPRAAHRIRLRGWCACSAKGRLHHAEPPLCSDGILGLRASPQPPPLSLPAGRVLSAAARASWQIFELESEELRLKRGVADVLRGGGADPGGPLGMEAGSEDERLALLAAAAVQVQRPGPALSRGGSCAACSNHRTREGEFPRRVRLVRGEGRGVSD